MSTAFVSPRVNTTSSPSRFSSTSTSHVSPWRIKVVVEAERDGGDELDEEGGGRIISPDIASITPVHVTKRRQAAPLRNQLASAALRDQEQRYDLSEDTPNMDNNETDFSMIDASALSKTVETPKRGRGRPRKSDVNNSKTANQTSAMTMPLRGEPSAKAPRGRKATPGRKRGSDSLAVLDESEVVSTSNISEQHAKRQRPTPSGLSLSSRIMGDENSSVASQSKKVVSSRNSFLRELTPNSSAMAIHAPSPSPSRRSSSSSGQSNQNAFLNPTTALRQASSSNFSEPPASGFNSSRRGPSPGVDFDDSIMQSEGFSMIAPDSSVLSSFSSSSGRTRNEMPPPPSRSNLNSVISSTSLRPVEVVQTDEQENIQTPAKKRRGRPPSAKKAAPVAASAATTKVSPVKRKRGRPSKVMPREEPEDEQQEDEEPDLFAQVASEEAQSTSGDPYSNLHHQVKDRLVRDRNPYDNVHNDVRNELAAGVRATRSRPGELASGKIAMVPPRTRAATPKRDNRRSESVNDQPSKDKQQTTASDGNIFTRAQPKKSQTKQIADFFSFLNRSAYVVPGNYNETTHFEHPPEKGKEKATPAEEVYESDNEEGLEQMLPDDLFSPTVAEPEESEEEPEILRLSTPEQSAQMTLTELPRTPEAQRSPSDAGSSDNESVGAQSVRWAFPIAGVSAKKHSPPKAPPKRLLDGVRIVEPHRPKAGLLADGSKKPLVVPVEWESHHWTVLSDFLFPKSSGTARRVRSMKPFYEDETPEEADASRRQILATLPRDDEDAIMLTRDESRAIDKFEEQMRRELVGPKKLAGETRREWGFSRNHIREALVIAKIGRERRRQWVTSNGGSLSDWGLE